MAAAPEPGPAATQEANMHRIDEKRRPTRRPKGRVGLAALIVGLTGLTGCGDAGMSDEMSGAGAPNASADAGAGEGSGAGGSGGQGPEDETESLAFSPPAVGDDHVWVTSRENDLLLRIDARSRAVTPIDVGDAPTAVLTLPGVERGVVLNRGSDELSVVDATVDPAEVAFVALPRHFNALALSPDGRFAVVWFDLALAEVGEDTTALQDAAILDIEAMELRAISTGFRPRSPIFTADGETCFLVTEDGVSVVELAHADAAPRLLPTATDPFLQDGREVAISPDGAFVVSRAGAGGESSISVLTPADGALVEIALPGEPTDLDLFADGRKALVMLREARRAVIVDVATGALDVSVDLPAALGSAAVAPDGARALLYTTLSSADLSPRFAALDLTTDPPELTQHPVRKEIAGAVIDPGGRAAWLLHRKADGEPDPTLSEADFLARSYGYSLVDMETLFVRLVTTPAEPRGVLFSADLARAWVPLSRPETGVHELQILDLDGLAVRSVPLPSAPETVGEVPSADRVFVTQSHGEGRISFLDRDSDRRETDALETLSGYLLNGRIE